MTRVLIGLVVSCFLKISAVLGDPSSGSCVAFCPVPLFLVLGLVLPVRVLSPMRPVMVLLSVVVVWLLVGGALKRMPLTGSLRRYQLPTIFVKMMIVRRLPAKELSSLPSIVRMGVV